MKKISIILLGLFSTSVIFAQTFSPAVSTSAGKIILTPGQKIVIENKVILEASFGMGMEMTGNSANENLLEVKNIINKSYTLSNTLTKVKLDMNMMGQVNSYDSENKEDNSSDIAKLFEGQLNKPVDITIENTTGRVIPDKINEKKDTEDETNPMQGMMDMFTKNSDEAVVSGAFELIPAGKKAGDTWTDTTVSKEMKAIRTYTLISVSAEEAVIQVDAIITALNKLDFQGMEFEIKTETKLTGETVTNAATSLVKKRTTQSEVTGSFQLMGQDMPITAKTNTVSNYK